MPEMFNRDEFRVQLLLALPETAFRRLPSTEAPDFDSLRRDTDYDAEKLAAWILERVDAAALAGDDAAGELASLATANGILSTSIEFSSYLEQLAAVLQRNMGIKEQWDLARTIGEEAKRLREIARAIVTAHPSLMIAVQPEQRTRLVSVGGDQL